MTRHENRVVKATILVLLLLGWIAASAAVDKVRNTAATDMLEGMAWAHAAVGAAIAAWGGATATIGRYLQASYSGVEWKWRGEVARDLMVSITVGVGGFWGGSVSNAPPMALGLALLLAGYLGVRLLAVVSERFLNAMQGKP